MIFQQTIINSWDEIKELPYFIFPFKCAIRACIIESTFVFDSVQAFFKGISVNDTLRHNNGFRTDASCPSKTCSEGSNCISEKSCCGDYPNRRVFKTQNGQRSCCREKTYDIERFECCDDGQIKVVCWNQKRGQF